MFDRTLLWQMFLLIRVTQEAYTEGYLGCFEDGGGIIQGGTRILDTKFYESDDNSGALCVQKCYSFGYKIAGTEYGNECWCGDEMVTNKSVSETECNEPCPGNIEESCGGSWRISIYDITHMFLTTHEQGTEVITSSITVNQSTPSKTQTSLSSSDKAISIITDASNLRTDANKSDMFLTTHELGTEVITSSITVNQSTPSKTQTSLSSSDKAISIITDASNLRTDANKSDDETGSLSVILYVTIPVAVVAVVAAVSVIVLFKQRRKQRSLVPEVVYNTTGSAELLYENPTGRENDHIQEGKQDSQKIYNRTETEQDVAESEYNTLGQEISKQLITDRTYDHVNTKDKPDDTYDHVDANEKSLLDNTYSHLSEHQKETTENAVLDTYSHIAKNI